MELENQIRMLLLDKEKSPTMKPKTDYVENVASKPSYSVASSSSKPGNSSISNSTHMSKFQVKSSENRYKSSSTQDLISQECGNSTNKGLTCSNCHTHNTPLWRRSPQGLPLCNACGLFFKLHGKVRPLSMKTDVVRKRNRVPASGTNNAEEEIFMTTNEFQYNSLV